LRKNPAVAPPRIEITRFHVEHSAIHIAPTHARPTLHELVLLRIDDVDREASSEGLDPFLRYAIDVDLEVSVGETHADRLREALVQDIANDDELRGPVTDQIPDVPGSKGSPAA
jgi:hypothetical protein